MVKLQKFNLVQSFGVVARILDLGKAKQMNKWKELCECGHRHGVHFVDGEITNVQPCSVEFCECMNFKKGETKR